MRTLSLKLNMYVKSVSIINNNIEKFILNVIICSFGALLILYVIFLGNMVRNIIERRSLEARAQTLSSEVRNLELTYLSMSSNIDLALSYSMGFKEIKASFATHKSLGLGQTGAFDSVKIAQNDI